MKTFTSVFYLMLISCMTFVASAQNNIDKAIAEIEKDPNADITCTEKRNPVTKKTYKISKVIRFTEDETALKVKDAFIKDSKNAIEYTRQDGKMYHLIFQEGECKMGYMLMKTSHKIRSEGKWVYKKIWMITVEIENTEKGLPKSHNKRKKSNYQTYKFNNNSIELYNGLDTLNIDLTSLKNLNWDFDSLKSYGNNFYYFPTE